LASTAPSGGLGGTLRSLAPRRDPLPRNPSSPPMSVDTSTDGLPWSWQRLLALSGLGSGALSLPSARDALSNAGRGDGLDANEQRNHEEQPRLCSGPGVPAAVDRRRRRQSAAAPPGPSADHEQLSDRQRLRPHRCRVVNPSRFPCWCADCRHAIGAAGATSFSASVAGGTAAVVRSARQVDRARCRRWASRSAHQWQQ
jgi:hypothetical protein